MKKVRFAPFRVNASGGKKMPVRKWNITIAPTSTKLNESGASNWAPGEAILSQVEGKLSQGKRRFGLARVMAELAVTSAAEISLRSCLRRSRKKLLRSSRQRNSPTRTLITRGTGFRGRPRWLGWKE